MVQIREFFVAQTGELLLTAFDIGGTIVPHSLVGEHLYVRCGQKREIVCGFRAVFHPDEKKESEEYP